MLLSSPSHPCIQNVSHVITHYNSCRVHNHDSSPINPPECPGGNLWLDRQLINIPFEAPLLFQPASAPPPAKRPLYLGSWLGVFLDNGIAMVSSWLLLMEEPCPHDMLIEKEEVHACSLFVYETQCIRWGVSRCHQGITVSLSQI